jgi:hypothetical protein
MEPGRFDDVEFRIVEEPDPQVPRRPRRIGHAMIAGVAAVALMGSLAAGASALTSTAQAPTRPAHGTSAPNWHHGYGKRDGVCHRGEGQRPSASALSY